jgi:opacity protein-like surface antigen
VDIDFLAPRAPFPSEAPRQLIKDGDTRFTYQLIGGIAVPLDSGLALTLEYRWLDAGTINAKDVRGERITRGQAGHNLGVGLRVNF